MRLAEKLDWKVLSLPTVQNCVFMTSKFTRETMSKIAILLLIKCTNKCTHICINILKVHVLERMFT
jgi:hypothetical protein